MIVGVGVDLCRVDRIRRSVDRFGKDWLDEVFTDAEQARLGPGEQLVQRAAMGFALKEACSKTIGTGFAGGNRRHNFLVNIDGLGCSIRLTGAARRRAVNLCGTSALVQLRTHIRSTAWVSALAVLEVGSSRSWIGCTDLLSLLPD
ncbi:holo-ACP synthase [Rhodoplanes roseus]|uniref:4'-phosphopantetheinyl transferase domain-containing protein n=1 Tax=Rhodoplanes roseus TaxID=29409 RepID=A0A327KPY6_9BRAD|nr:hypothetical protein CH341_23745 [Rhodoplanes roseus]